MLVSSSVSRHVHMYVGEFQCGWVGGCWILQCYYACMIILCFRYRSRIRGLFSAITYPTSIGPLITQGSFQQKLFLCKLILVASTGGSY